MVMGVEGGNTSCNPAPQSINHSSNPFANKVIDNDLKPTNLVSRVGIESDFSRSAKRFKEVEVRTTELVNKNRTMSLKNLRSQEEMNRLSSILAPNESILEKEQFRPSQAQYPRQKNSILSPNIPSTSKNPSPLFGGEMTGLENLHHGCSMLKMPQSVHDVETMRICTSVEGLAGGPPIFSQTTHSFLITKKTDVSLCKENQIFRESRVSSQLTGNTLGRNHSLVPLFGHGRAGVKLQSISSSTDSDGEENIPHFKAFEGRKNESSTKTNTVDLDYFKGKNHPFGAYASASKKVIMADPSVSPQPKIASAEGEFKHKHCITELPDINVELLAPPAAGTSMGNGEPSTSKTLSLDMELLFPSVNLTNPKPNQSQSGSLGPDPNSRWVKRLKSNSIALGTKSSKLGQSSAVQMANMFFGKITEDSITNTELTLGNGGSNKEGDITLSHPWIQRWCHNRAVTPQKKRKPDDCGPQRSKVASQDIEKKQFPSIAAMALMGKAMNGFQPCEFRKRGSFLVWNTGSF